MVWRQHQMNANVERLLKQATKEVWGNNDYNGAPEFEGYEVDQELFADLLIKACAAQVCIPNERNNILNFFNIK